VSRFGQFLGCTGYPECTYTEPLERREAEPIGEACPKCGRPLLRKEGRYGSFIACSGYPECDYTRDDGTPTGHTCPKCGGRVLAKRSKRGKPYFKCENRDCDFLSFYPLLPTPCPTCGWPLVEKGKKAACMNPACPDHDPALVPGPMEAKPKKAAKKKPPALPKDWEALKAFLPGLPEAERRALEGLAQGKTLSEEEASLAKKALFKLRMRKGRARKEVAPA